MRKITKLSLGFGVFIFFLIILIFFLPFLIPLDKFLPRIESSLENALHRKIKIEKLQLSLIPSLGLDLKGVEVFNQNGFSPQPFIQVGEAQVRLSVLALLHHQFLVQKIVLKTPQILLERNQKGEFNFQDLTKRKTRSAQPESPKTKTQAKEKKGFELKLLGRELMVKSFQIKNARLGFIDAMEGASAPRQLWLYHLEVEVKDISGHKPLALELGFCSLEKCSSKEFSLKATINPASKGWDFYSLPMDLEAVFKQLKLTPFLPYFEKFLPLAVKSGEIKGRIRASGTGSNLKAEIELALKNLNLREPRAGWQTLVPLISLKIPLQGSINPLKIQAKNSQLKLGSSQLEFELELERTSQLAYQLVVKNSTLAWKEVLGFYPPIKTRLSEKNLSLNGSFELEGKIRSASPLNFQLALNLAQSGLVYPGVMEKKPGEKMNLELNGVKKGSGISLDNFKLEFAPGKIQGELDLARTSPLKGNFSLSSPGLDLDKILSEEKKKEKPQEKKREPKPAPEKPQTQPRSLQQADLNGKIKISHLKARGYELNDFSTRVNLRQGKLSLSPLSARAFGGNISGRIKLDLNPKGKLSGKLNISQVELAQALAQIRTLKDNFQGKVNLQLKFQAPWEEWDKIKSRLWAEGDLKIDQGVLLTLDLLGNLLGDWASSDAFRSFLQKQIGKKEWEVLNQTRFKQLEGKFQVGEGRVNFPSLVMMVEDGRMDLKGKFGFDYQLDFKGKMSFTRKASEELSKKMGLSEDARKILFYQGTKLVLPLKIKGRYPKVQVQLDQKEYGKIIQENLKKQAEEKIRQEGEKLIKDLLEQILPK